MHKVKDQGPLEYLCPFSFSASFTCKQKRKRLVLKRTVRCLEGSDLVWSCLVWFSRVEQKRENEIDQLVVAV